MARVQGCYSGLTLGQERDQPDEPLGVSFHSTFRGSRIACLWLLEGGIYLVEIAMIRKAKRSKLARSKRLEEPRPCDTRG